jgi:hypothetical protein
MLIYTDDLGTADVRAATVRRVGFVSSSWDTKRRWANCLGSRHSDRP